VETPRKTSTWETTRRLGDKSGMNINGDKVMRIGVGCNWLRIV
jgi:hypothetical protein